MSTSPHECLDKDLNPIEHEENTVDYRGPNGSQSYQIYQCSKCHDYWGVRHQYDHGTGRDDRPHRFGPDITTIKRHY